MLIAVLCVVSLEAADPAKVVVWRAGEMKKLEQKVSTNIDTARHLGLERLLDSATLIYRDGPSEAEVHQKLADFIIVRDGEGVVLVGGKMIDGTQSAPDELRGRMEGGTKYTFAAGDTLYIPANTVHQFLVDKGKHYLMTIVKITPKP